MTMGCTRRNPTVQYSVDMHADPQVCKGTALVPACRVRRWLGFNDSAEESILIIHTKE